MYINHQSSKVHSVAFTEAFLCLSRTFMIQWIVQYVTHTPHNKILYKNSHFLLLSMCQKYRASKPKDSFLSNREESTTEQGSGRLKRFTKMKNIRRAAAASVFLSVPMRTSRLKAPCECVLSVTRAKSNGGLVNVCVCVYLVIRSTLASRMWRKGAAEIVL